MNQIISYEGISCNKKCCRRYYFYERNDSKNVDLFGDSIIAAQDKDGIVWAGARWFCQGLGFSKGQIDRQIKNIQKDSALSKGASNLTLPTNGGKQDVLCIKLDFIPLWLAKISITDKTRKERPEFADKLLEYQLKAKDIQTALQKKVVQVIGGK